MKQLLLVFITCTLTISAWGTGGGENRDDPKYPVSSISEDLLEDAHVVIRKRDYTFTVINRGETHFREHVVYTIMNDKADRFAVLYEMYSPLIKITEFEGTVYDKNGEEIDKIRKSDIKDESYVTGANLYADNRIQYADMTQPDYPYTVEFISERVVKKYYETPNIVPVFTENLAVEESVFTMIAPEELMPRYRQFNYKGEPSEIFLTNNRSLRWEFTNLKAIEIEPLSEGIRAFAPYIETAPSIFEYEGYAGDMNSWESFGKWIWQLNSGRDKLPTQVIEEVKKLTEGMTDREKVKAVYEYMQNRTRYVSISLGIGALQPFEASVVNNVGYGDCKALSNYTVSLIRELGIEANYVLIYGGNHPEDLDPDFPAHSFNHAIVNVPLEQDTVWLECTSQTKPFNYMGVFTGDRDALMITEDGGVIVKTPTYKLKDNQRIRKASVRFDETGNAKVDVTTNYQGIHYDLRSLSGYLNTGKEDQKKWILRNTDISNFDLGTFEMKNVKDEVPNAIVNIDLTITRYASKTGKRFYFIPNLMSKVDVLLKPDEDRQSDFIREYSLSYLDTIEFNFPSNYQVEYLPEKTVYDSEFGHYEASSEFVQGKLIYYRKFDVYSGKFDAGKYDEFIKFYEKIEALDKAKVVFTTKT